MNYFDAIVYGITQGLTEFLPVSSSGHLALLPYLLKITDPGVSFDLAMHLGTALSILFYFKSDVKKHLHALGQLKDQHETRNMVVATISTFIFALIFKPLTQEFGRDPKMIAFNLIFFGALMLLADVYFKQTPGVGKNMSYLKSVTYGFFQSLAIFPGVSRSGVTLTYSRLISMSRDEATRFSFLLALPLIFAGFILKLPEMMAADASFSIMTCFFGIVISFISGIVTIHFFLKIIKKIGLWIFFIYRLILGICLLWYLS